VKVQLEKWEWEVYTSVLLQMSLTCLVPAIFIHYMIAKE